MSIIALRRMLSRQGRLVAVLAIAFSVGALAVHHGGVHEGHGAGAEAPAGMHADHDLAADPAGHADNLVLIAVCLAVLPLLGALVAAVWGARLRRGWWRAVSGFAAGVALGPPDPPGRLARAGPQLLCVMRC